MHHLNSHRVELNLTNEKVIFEEALLIYHKDHKEH
jgi:hypothetical protein